MVASIGPAAAQGCEPRQVRKEATVAAICGCRHVAGARYHTFHLTCDSPAELALSYQALARQWRPRAFSDMVGQETIVRIFTNALARQRLHHAYLLTGTRGVGKTTLARIIAKCINCETGITPTPCGTCPTCLEIDAGQCLDLHEIDAASRTKVEDTRELLDNVLYPPTRCRYKVYLIDEVHMLSQHSFNALLKTLEEPPEHVKFILATTDPDRLPMTVLSRCLRFHLTRITVPHITQQLSKITEKEKIASEPAALNLLAEAADGSMRDALSLLDQAIAYGAGTIKAESVREMLGTVAPIAAFPILQALAKRSGEALFAAIQNLVAHAVDYEQALTALIDALHQLAISQVVPEIKIENPALADLAQQFSPEDIQLYYQIALLGRRDLVLHMNPQQGFEMTLLRMLAFKPLPIEIRNSAVRPAETVRPEEPAKQPSHKATPETANWRTLLPQLKLTGMTLALAQNCVLEQWEGDKVVLALASTHQPMLNAKSKERLIEALSHYKNQPIQLEIRISDTTTLMTPIKQAQTEQETAQAEARTTVMQNPHIKQWIETYDATVSVSLLA